MGQYYNPIILKKNWKLAKQPVERALKCYDFDHNGAKLMEHSYIHNSFVGAFMHLLSGRYFGYPFVWCGDYADAVKTRTGEHDLYTDAYDKMYDKEGNTLMSYKSFLKTIPKEYEHHDFLVNLTKKEIVVVPTYKKDVWQVHPLPLLTCFGNGRGGGDYCLQNDKYNYEKDERIGSWAFDRIGVTDNVSEYIKDGYKVIDGHFDIDW